MEAPSKDYRQMAEAYQIANAPVFTRNAVDYYQSLCNPFDYPSKIPLGFPVKSNAVHLSYRVPLIFNGASVLIGANSYTLTTAGTDVVFWFNPNRFDASSMLQASFTSVVSATTIFTNWIDQATSKGFATNYASYRLVSAGIRFKYSATTLYAIGQIIASESNARLITDYGTGATGLANFQADVDNEIIPFGTFISKPDGTVYSSVYSPTDLGSLDFINTSLIDANNQDWSVFLDFNGWNGSGGLSGYLEIAVNYECVPYGTYEQLLSPTLNPGGTHGPVMQVVAKANEKKEKISKEEAMKMADILNPSYVGKKAAEGILDFGKSVWDMIS